MRNYKRTFVGRIILVVDLISKVILCSLASILLLVFFLVVNVYPFKSGIWRKENRPNPEGYLFGEVLVFTGALGIPRREVADIAAKIGCTLADGVTKDTTILVVGDQDVKKLAGHDKSSKHRTAESLIKKGQALRIIRESDFKELVNLFIKGSV
jgi:hypothetical protein